MSLGTIGFLTIVRFLIIARRTGSPPPLVPAVLLLGRVATSPCFPTCAFNSGRETATAELLFWTEFLLFLCFEDALASSFSYDAFVILDEFSSTEALSLVLASSLVPRELSQSDGVEGISSRVSPTGKLTGIRAGLEDPFGFVAGMTGGAFEVVVVLLSGDTPGTADFFTEVAVVSGALHRIM